MVETVDAEITELTQADYTCSCGHSWECWPDYIGPLKCSKCGLVQPVEVRGLGALTQEQLGHALGKYSHCSDCDALTLNVPGMTHCHQPIESSDLAYGGKVWRGGQWIEVTTENAAEIYFGCADCDREKFWTHGYNCPQCDSDAHALIESTDLKYNMAAAMEYGGTPYDWQEFHKCLLCGYEFWMNNSNY